MSVSTEVQRTLVKSPPELWAELSDPAALARHLSELGEVRITRTKPEQLVEWEAVAQDGAKASGKVEISASGWGTRVTFSATQAIAPPASSPSSPSPELEDKPTPSTPPTADAILQRTPNATTSPEAAGAWPRASPDAPPLEEPPAPSRLLAGIDALTDEDLPAEDESLEDPLDGDDLDDPYSDDDLDFDDDPHTEDDLDDEDELLVQADHAIDRERRHAVTAANQPPPEPRRGFFARLFGLRPRASQPDRDPEARVHGRPVTLALEPHAEITGQLPPPELPSAVAIAEQATDSYEAVGVEPPGDGQAESRAYPLAERDATLIAEARAAESGPARAESRAARAAESGPARAESLPGPAQTQATQAVQSEPVATEPRPVDLQSVPAERPTVEPQATQAVEQTATQAVGQDATRAVEGEAAIDRAPDVAAELQGAEEAAGAQVTAVLTSALDRLGAAHHRPFSRA